MRHFDEIKSNIGTVLTWGHLICCQWATHTTVGHEIKGDVGLPFSHAPTSLLILWPSPLRRTPCQHCAQSCLWFCDLIQPSLCLYYIFLIKVWSMDRVTLTNTQQVTHTSTALLTVLFPSPRAMLRSLHISKGAHAMQLATSHMVLKGPGSSPAAPSICWIILMTRKKVENNSQHQKSAWRTDKHS